MRELGCSHCRKRVKLLFDTHRDSEIPIRYRCPFCRAVWSCENQATTSGETAITMGVGVFGSFARAIAGDDCDQLWITPE